MGNRGVGVSKYDGATIDVVNWDKFNPRTDAKRPNWFRLENTLATGPGFHDLDCEQKWLWVVILSLVSQKNGGPIEWKSSYIQALTGIKPKKQDDTLEIFEKFVRLRVSREVTSKLNEVTSRDSHATDITDGHNGRTDGHNGRTSCHPLFEIWNSNRGSLPQAKEMTPDRKRHADSRWQEKPSTEYWTEVVVRMSRSPFCRGERNKPDSPHKSWKADFDFFLRPGTHAKVMEGKYDEKRTSGNVDLEQLDRELRQAGVDVA